MADQQNKKLLCGFIGQGFIGKNYADDFEQRGYDVVRYAREEPYVKNKDKIKDCDIVFIAVPTPTIPEGFDDSILQDVLKLVGEGKTAVIKSTIIPGTTKKLQELYPDIIVLHSPEFLTEVTAKYDAKHPQRNIIGYSDEEHAIFAEEVMQVLPVASYKAIVPVEVAEMIKYGGNCWFYFKIIYMNLLYDLCESMNIDYEMVKEGMSWDVRIGHTHLDVNHQGGRGAGGHCFIKDFAAFVEMHNKNCSDDAIGRILLKHIEKENIKLLKNTNKNLDLLEGVYGKDI